MMIKLESISMCEVCFEKSIEYLRISTRLPLSDDNIWGPNAVGRAINTCGCKLDGYTYACNDIEKIRESNQFLQIIVIKCKHIFGDQHEIDSRMLKGDMYLLGYPGKEYILLTNSKRRNILENFLSTNSMEQVNIQWDATVMQDVGDWSNSTVVGDWGWTNPDVQWDATVMQDVGDWSK